MAAVYREMGIDHHTYIGPIATEGVRIISSN